MTNDSLIAINSTAKSLQGYLQALKPGSVVTHDYVNRLLDHYVPNLLNTIAAMGGASAEGMHGIQSSSPTNDVATCRKCGHRDYSLEDIANHQCEIRYNEEFYIEELWRLFDQFQSPTIGNRSPSAEASARRKAKEVYERLAPYLRTTEPVSVSLEKAGDKVKQLFDLTLIEPNTGVETNDIAKACAEAWGLSYVD